jgi:hypothetical protein
VILICRYILLESGECTETSGFHTEYMSSMCVMFQGGISTKVISETRYAVLIMF